MNRHSLARYAWLSIAAALLTMGLKLGAYLLTGSVGLLSDGLESLVNLAAACMALAMLAVAALPADENHAYGHSKAEYFASATEGLLILAAAASIAWAAAGRLFEPQPIAQPGLGLAIAVLASLINLGAARLLAQAGRRHGSITLESNAQHLMTDVWTSAGVVCGVALVWLTGWQRLDPLIALVVAAHIVWTGLKLVWRSAMGLMDAALPADELAIVRGVLDTYAARGVEYHALRTRQAAARRFVSLHLLVPNSWTVQQGHSLADAVEGDIRAALPNASVFTHLEPRDDPSAWDDLALEQLQAVDG
jgi:cation diffusion facilitator family transporter